MNRDELELLREGWDFEAKLAAGRDGLGAVPDSFWETYSAMANTQGGSILLGARERSDGTLELRGLGDIDKVERDLWNTLENPSKVSANLLSREAVQRLDVDGKSLLLIEIPKAPRSARPVHLNGSWERHTYLRVHEGDRVCDREIARRMLADSVANRDGFGIESFTIDDLFPESVRRYREYFRSQRPDHPFLTESDEGFLICIGALVRDRARNVVEPSTAGLLMLGKELSICELLPHWHLSYRELPDDPNDSRRWLDRLAPDGTWNANLFEFYMRAIRKLHDGLKVPFALEAGQFRIDDTPVHQAVREALVNTLVHADYQGRSGVRLIRARSSFEFINPGLLLVSPEQVWRGGVSESRNPALQKLFGFLQLGEREGSGGPKVRHVWQQQHWRLPHLGQDTENSETHLVLRQESLLPEPIVNALVSRLRDGFTNQDELGRSILVTAEAEGSITHARARELTERHSRDVTLKLQELLRRGYLESDGKTRGTTYRPVGGVTIGHNLGSLGSLGNLGKSEKSSQNSEESDASSERSIGHNIGHSDRPRGRGDPEEQRQAILAYCCDDWRTVPEIAGALGRSEDLVRRRYLPPLLKQRALERLHPAHPRHPLQAYRTTRKDP